MQWVREWSCRINEHISRRPTKEHTKGVVPEIEQIANLVHSNLDSISSRLGSFRHDGRMVMRDLPLTMLVDVNEGVSGLDLVTSRTHGEFVDSGITCPSITNGNVSIKDDTLRCLGKEVIKVVLDTVIVCSGFVTHSR